MEASIPKGAYSSKDQDDLLLIKSQRGDANSDRNYDRCQSARTGRGRAVKPESHFRLAPADELGQRFAGAGAMRPAQRAVAGVDPQLADFGFANVGDIGG